MAGVSLYDCFLNGPAALADLSMATLGIQEHSLAFAKDISKFYRFIEADQVAQHVKRVPWRFGTLLRGMNSCIHFVLLILPFGGVGMTERDIW